MKNITIKEPREKEENNLKELSLISKDPNGEHFPQDEY
jgi:hypothetical protein